MKKNEYSWIVLAMIAMVITFLCVVSGNFFTQKISLQIGEIAKETFYAPFQVENEEATIRKRYEQNWQFNLSIKRTVPFKKKLLEILKFYLSI